MPSQNNEFCLECQDHHLIVKSYIDNCAGQPCSSEIYERIWYQYMALQAIAQTCNKTILYSYAQEMASFARYLYHQSHDSVSQDEHDLLVEGVQMGLLCEKGQILAACPEMNFDKLWETISKMRAYNNKGVGKQAAIC